MKKLIATLFGGSPAGTTAKRAPASNRDNPLTIEDGSDNATRRQLVQVLLRDALRKYGIPPRWIDCQMLLVNSRSRGQGMYVRLVVREWDDRLMNYAFAFQNALMVEITRFEPQASQWLHGISWQLDVAQTCPHRSMPDKSFWADPVAPPVRPVRPAQPLVQPIAPLFEPMSAATAAAAAAPILASLGQAQAAQAEQPAPAVSVEAAAPRAPVAPDSDAMKDLERLFRIRDQELGMRGESNPAPVGYEATRPSPL
ncbi:hypothetical protein [Polaromonas sp. LjRoot131]|uniref:hypothetical protein n=1 Tax=Polaromonas sp. LjRoot131 TaxID=3342262 RepID=UPI003ECF5974